MLEEIETWPDVVLRNCRCIRALRRRGSSSGWSNSPDRVIPSRSMIRAEAVLPRDVTATISVRPTRVNPSSIAARAASVA